MEAVVQELQQNMAAVQAELAQTRAVAEAAGRAAEEAQGQAQQALAARAPIPQVAEA